MWIDCGETKNIQTKRDKQKNGETELKSYSMHCPQYFILTFHLDHYEILCHRIYMILVFVIIKLLCYYLLLAYCYVRFYNFLKSRNSSSYKVLTVYMIQICPKEKYFYFYIENSNQIYISFLNFYFNNFVIINLSEAEQ